MAHACNAMSLLARAGQLDRAMRGLPIWVSEALPIMGGACSSIIRTRPP